jgi:hypothetical protein
MITILQDGIQTGCKCRHCGTIFLYDREDIISNVKAYGISTLGVMCPRCGKKLSMMVGEDTKCFFKIDTKFKIYQQKWWERLFTVSIRF